MITDAYRSNEQQDAIPSDRTTKAGGESYHNYGLAFDAYPVRNGQPDLSNSRQNQRDQTKLGAIGVRNGFGWGGNWTHPHDPAHFEMRGGHTIKELQKLKADGKWTP